MNILFVKSNLAFPRGSGHDVHGYEMMRGIENLGHKIHLLTRDEATEAACEGLSLQSKTILDLQVPKSFTGGSSSYLQRRFQNYWGIPDSHLKAAAKYADLIEADAVVTIGLDVLPYLTYVDPAKKRIWYAADEWLYHHLSRISFKDRDSWKNIKSGIISGLYEYSYSRLVDCSWFVSPTDTNWGKWVMPFSESVCIPNGVDAIRYSPRSAEQIERTCTIWGRLDFAPNIDAILWFTKYVWQPNATTLHGAKLNIFGFNPCEQIRNLETIQGVSVIPDLPDLRDEIARQQVVILPFTNGGGIKNKLLEAAAMQKAIIASRVAVKGLGLGDPKPLEIANSPNEWLDRLVELWESPQKRIQLGKSAREWVEESYSWHRAAKSAAITLS